MTVRVNITDQSQCIQSTPTNDSNVSMKDECDETLTTNLFFLEDNPVAKILWTLHPRTLQSILLSMAATQFSENHGCSNTALAFTSGSGGTNSTKAFMVHLMINLLQWMQSLTGRNYMLTGHLKILSINTRE